MAEKKLAVVRVRGLVNIRKGIKDTLTMLRLYNKNYCVFLDQTPQTMGMLKKVKDFVTYGEIDEALLKDLISKRGEEYTGRLDDGKGKVSYSRRFMEFNGKKYKKFLRLSPPRKGYGRKGIKYPFSRGGALGNRKEKMADLLSRMI